MDRSPLRSRPAVLLLAAALALTLVLGSTFVVLHHLKAYGPDPRNTVVFAGYQAAGTRGEALLNGAREVKIHGQWIPIRAEIANLPMLSAHADVDEIMRWLGGFRSPPKRTFIVHGEPVAAQALQQRIEADLGWKTTVSEQDEPYALA